MTALLVLAASCKKEKKETPNFTGDGFLATVEIPASDSRTVILNDKDVEWESDDQITVKSSSAKPKYNVGQTFTAESGGSSVVFRGDRDLAPDGFFQAPYTALYGSDVSISGSTYTLTLPQEQTYKANGFSKGANPMMAYAESGNTLNFKNICGILCLQYKSDGNTPCYVKSIKVTSKTDENLWGTGTVSYNGGNPYISSWSSGGNSITLDCSADGGVPLNTTSATKFYIVVPKDVFGSGFKVEMTLKDGTRSNNKGDVEDVWTKDGPSEKIVRSKINRMAVLTVNADVIPHAFTVNSAGKTVYFSKGNLYYDGECKIEDTVYAGGKQKYRSNHIQHFYWNSVITDAVGTNYNGNTTLFTNEGQDGSPNASFSINGAKDKWFTLTKNEWNYLLFTRNVSSSNRYACVKVMNYNCLMLVPDNFSWPVNTDDPTKPIPKPEYNVNPLKFPAKNSELDYNENQLYILQKAGCVFLVVAGTRDNTSITNASNGRYWSSNIDIAGYQGVNSKGWRVKFSDGLSTSNVISSDYISSEKGQSIRPVVKTTDYNN